MPNPVHNIYAHQLAQAILPGDPLPLESCIRVGRKIFWDEIHLARQEQRKGSQWMRLHIRIAREVRADVLGLLKAQAAGSSGDLLKR